MSKYPSIKKLKILLVCEYFYPHIGGVEKQLSLHTRILGKTGMYDFRVATSLVPNSKIAESFSKCCFIYRYKWPSLFGHPIACFKDLIDHILWADCVHTTTYTTAIQALLLAKLFGKPCVITVHEVLGKDWILVSNNLITASLFRFYEMFLLKLPFSYFHSVSNHTHQKLLNHVDGRRAMSIYPFVEKPQLSKKVEIKYHDYFLYFGRAGKTKGLNILLSAVKYLASLGEYPTFILIVGSHPKADRRAIEKKIINLALNNIVLLKSQPQNVLISHIKNAKAVIAPSLTEGFGYSAYEASSLGTPVIYSNDTSLVESVRIGIPFMKGSSSSLADAILSIDNVGVLSKKNNLSNIEQIAKWTQLYYEIN